ncbi:thermonuclease family protein [Iodidimonas muriae]|nr:thermonuclease family protein [Iodidimonas muriae]
MANAQEITPLDPLGPALDMQLARIEDGLVLVAKDGRHFVLAGLWPLRRSHEGGDITEDGLARMAKQRIERHLDHRLQIYPMDQTPDRYGRIRAHLVAATKDGKGLWINAMLLQQGLARAFPLDDIPMLNDALYAAEATARAQNIGFWASARNALYAAGDEAVMAQKAGEFAIVTGPIRSATKVDGTVYLNFGDDWRTDFTIRLLWPIRRTLPKGQRDPSWWAHKTVEVRGVLEDLNGPLVTPLAPAQIRVLPASPTRQSDPAP